MATIITSIGSNSSIATGVPDSCSGSFSPYVVTFVSTPSGVSVGDKCVFTDEGGMGAEFTYRVTAVSGADITMVYVTDDMMSGDTSPCLLYNMMFSQADGTFSRYYSTISAWEADLDDSDLYASSDIAQGSMYNDSAFNEDVTIDGGDTVSLASRVLTVPSSQRHDGTAGTGARIVRTVDVGECIEVAIAPTTVEWLEIDMSDNECIRGAFKTDTSSTTTSTFLGCIAHSIATTVTGGDTGTHSRAFWADGNTDILNCIAYDLTSGGTSGYCDFFKMNGSSTYTQNFYNCTGYNANNNSASGNTNAFQIKNHANKTVKNCISMGVSGSSSGTADCFNEPASAVMQYNMSSDATAGGTGSLASKTTADQFVSITGGSEDLHLKDGSDAIGAGTDLGTTPANVNFDIDGRDRDDEGDTWDIGADQTIPSPNVTVDISEKDGVLSVTSSAQAPVPALGISAGATALSSTATVVDPALYKILVAPSEISAAATAQAPAIQIDCTKTVSAALNAVSSIPTPAVIIDGVVSAAVLSVTASVNAPEVDTPLSISVVAASATVVAPVVQVKYSAAAEVVAAATHQAPLSVAKVVPGVLSAVSSVQGAPPNVNRKKEVTL